MDDESNTHSPQIDSGVKHKGPRGPAKLNANFIKQRNGDYFQHYEIDKKKVRGAFIKQALATFIDKAKMSGFTVEKAGRLRFQYYIKERTQKRRVILKQKFKIIPTPPSFEHYLKRRGKPKAWSVHTFCVRLTLEGGTEKIKINSCAWPQTPENRYENAHFYTLDKGDEDKNNPEDKKNFVNTIKKKVEFAIENLFTFQKWEINTYNDVISANIALFSSNSENFIEKEVLKEDKKDLGCTDFTITLTNPSNITHHVIDPQQPKIQQSTNFQEYGFLVRVFHANNRGKWEIYSLRDELNEHNEPTEVKKHLHMLSSIFTRFSGDNAKLHEDESSMCDQIFREHPTDDIVTGMAGSFFTTLTKLKDWQDKHDGS